MSEWFGSDRLVIALRPTIGYGHLVHTGKCDGSESAEFRKGVTRERALEILGEDAASAAAAVNDAVKVPLEQDQFDALTSFVFNVGSGAFGESTLLKLLNEGNTTRCRRSSTAG